MITLLGKWTLLTLAAASLTFGQTGQPKPKASSGTTQAQPTATRPRLVAQGHPEIVVVAYTPVTESQNGKLTVRAYNPSGGSNFALTKPVTLRISDRNGLVRSLTASKAIPSLGRTGKFEATFDLAPPITVRRDVRTSVQQWRLRFSAGLNMDALTTASGEPDGKAQYLFRWPVASAYSHEPMNVRGPFERTLDTSAAPIAAEAPPRALRATDEHILSRIRATSGRVPSATGQNDSIGEAPSAAILRGVFLANQDLKGLDTNVAAGPNAVCVSVSRSFQFYDKTGQPLRTKDGSKELGRMKYTEFFEPLVEDVRANLQLSQAFRDKGYDNCDYYDSRCIYDPYRRRFWLVSLVTNKFEIDGNAVNDQDARRNKIACAVSKTSDPRDGFWMYWWDATPYDGQPNTDWKAGDRGDYPSLGIAPKFFMQTNHVNWKHRDGSDNADLRWAMVTIVNADALAAGSPQYGWMFPRLKDANGDQIARVTMPAMQYGPFPNNRAYLTQHRGGNMLVWGFDAFFDFPRSPRLVAFPLREVAGAPDIPQKSTSGISPTPVVKVSNISAALLRTVVRGNRMWTVFQEGVTWSGQTTPYSAVRYITASLSDFANGSIPQTAASGYLERTFGKRHKTEDASAIFGYGMPAVEVDGSGNALIAYVRSGSTIFQQARFTIHRAGEADVRPSMVLRNGEGTLSDGDEIYGQLDCVGAGLDPDGNTIWIAVPYAFLPSGATAAQYRIAVGRVRL